MAHNIAWGTALTGGGTGALDAEDGAGLSDKDAAFIVTASNFYVYSLDADSGLVESSPDVIKPDANAGNKRWIMVYMRDAIISNPSSDQHQIKSIKQLASGEWKVIYEGVPEP